MDMRDPRTGHVTEDVVLSDLRSGDRLMVAMDDWHDPALWDITIISVDPVMIFHPDEVWITGIHQHIRCRVLVRVRPGLPAQPSQLAPSA